MSVVILDFGSQYTRLIARRLRELNAFSVVLPGAASLDEIDQHNPQALVLSGSPASIHDRDPPRPRQEVLAAGLPTLGICYGMHCLVEAKGGRVAQAQHREYGRALLSGARGPLFRGLPQGLEVWMSHADAVQELPPDWEVAAFSPDCAVAAAYAVDGSAAGVQFHPEVTHTPEGAEVLANFLEMAGVRRDWTPENTLQLLLDGVRRQVGSDRVLLGLSGGVDSTTLAALLARAGVDHKAIFVDHGLLRHAEGEEVEATVRAIGVNLEAVDAASLFLQRLQGVEDPEDKRRAIGGAFVEVFEEQARCLGPFRFLAQGTLYPDVIESAGATGAASIKSHHNVGGLPERLGFELLEPFRFLFKDEVRELAKLLNLPDHLRLRHPFPGPGLAVRILGEVTPGRLEILRQADAEFVAALREHGLYDQVWQALAVLTPVRSTGVGGDGRTYGHVVALRAVTSVDGMTADWAQLPLAFLDQVAARITRRVPGVGRVVYDITSKPPATIEWE
ncbi:MAG: glutamine-hydrolyzing GMP synthase [Candidatus Bipolaricaulota bacterium]